ncbi:hypothetical protein [uncultured Flavobacterium sp.]|uniref:hypothetical protein n=1 Tax=uncultured Flavobacterium sp. TaxID=165435 RepID=UPI0030ECC0E3|tara:strand:+ start:2163 stop:3059 length:897 start_codon:yes stop_codon:yes gene_type:complete
MKNSNILLYVLTFCLPIYLLAQDSTNTQINKLKSYILTDVSFQNDAVFMGRNDSITAPYLVPSIGYYDASGFFADASLSYLTKSNENRVDLFLFTAGYRFESKKFSGYVSGTKYFFNDISYNIQSEIVADVSAIISYDLNIIKTSLTTSTYFNKNSNPDFFVGAHLAKEIHTRDESFEIIPTLSLYAGSQYFYEEYYKYNKTGNNQIAGNGSGQNQQVESVVIDINEVNKFNLLSIELSMPINYYYKSFIISITPQLAFPQSNATFTTEDAVFKENLKEVFYWSAGISYWFNTSKDNK